MWGISVENIASSENVSSIFFNSNDECESKIFKC